MVDTHGLYGIGSLHGQVETMSFFRVVVIVNSLFQPCFTDLILVDDRLLGPSLQVSLLLLDAPFHLRILHSCVNDQA